MEEFRKFLDSMGVAWSSECLVRDKFWDLVDDLEKRVAEDDPTEDAHPQDCEGSGVRYATYGKTIES